ncbi:hypothetical protein EYC80_004260 [Monilinia laxa]|uniref:Uncharacterized protein n=1 Tax=Monilinia laxa TaxID=61186 RepID=A0A5N6KMB0_MONLA|nr:hypothetical protein EYC80_004260 [Monilinia laxa]
MPTIFPDQVLQTSSTTVTTWLPLSTAWPSTAACSSLVYVGTGKDAGKIFGWDPLYQAVLDTGSPRCFAEEMVTWWFQPSSAVISLGPTFHCPAAYSTVATSVHSAGVTQVFCCPTDYKLSTLLPSHTPGDYPNQCMSTLTSGDILKYQIPTGGIYQPTSLTVSETALVHGEHINGWNIDDAVFASMTAALQTSTNTALLSSTAYTTSIGGSESVVTAKLLDPATATSSSSVSPSSSSSTAIPSTNISSTSPALAAGIGVGVAILVIVLAAAFSIFIRRRKKIENSNANMTKETDPAENYQLPVFYERPAGELPAEHPVREMDGEAYPIVERKEYHAPRVGIHEL